MVAVAFAAFSAPPHVACMAPVDDQLSFELVLGVCSLDPASVAEPAARDSLTGHQDCLDSKGNFAMYPCSPTLMNTEAALVTLTDTEVALGILVAPDDW